MYDSQMGSIFTSLIIVCMCGGCLDENTCHRNSDFCIFILIKLTDEPSICKLQLFSFIFINHGHLSVRCLWSSGHTTPKYSTLARWIFKAEEVWENGRSRKVIQPSRPFLPETAQYPLWEVPSLFPEERSIFILEDNGIPRRILPNGPCCLPSSLQLLRTP